MPNGNVSFIGVAYGDLADGNGYRKILRVEASKSVRPFPTSIRSSA